MANIPPLKDRLLALLEPTFMLYHSAKHFLKTTFETVFVRKDPLALLHPHKIRDESFSRFWLEFTSIEPPADISELIGSAALVPPLLKEAAGDVLEIGPGSGALVRYMPKPSSSAVKRIYGAEPSTHLHAQLRRRADAAGLGSDYVILSCPAEEGKLAKALADAGISVDGSDSGKGLFDTIVCMRVLCSIPDPEKVAENLYRLLKPGGKLLVMEHVVNPWRTAKGSLVARALQVFYMKIGRWRFFMGECCMNRDSAAMLRQVAKEDGGWASVEIERHFGWSPLSYISGRLVKKGEAKRLNGH